MLKIEKALQLQKRALNAVAELDAIVSDVRDECSEDDFRLKKRGVGLSIGRIQIELLEPIYKQHPEMDDLKDYFNMPESQNLGSVLRFDVLAIFLVSFLRGLF